jgi:hypothetical protein
MLMVFIVTMRMLVFHSFMQMVVLVLLGQKHPYSKNHEHERRPERERPFR